MFSRQTDIGLGLVVALLALLLGPPAAGAADAGCGSKVLYVAAHQDDTLIFQSPDLLRDVERGRCVRTIFTTAGDPALGEGYRRARDAGAEAAYAEMAGVPDEWTETDVVADGHPLSTVTLDADPRISIVFMRLPDGAPDGKGYPLYGNESLVKLWRGGNPGHGGPTIGEITSVDGVSTYTYRGLVETLEQLIASYGPDRIATQNFAERLFEGDHPDHTATAYFVKLAAEGYPRAHRLVAYQGYQDAERPADVSGQPLVAKTAAFYAYGAHDVEACADDLSCSGTIYPAWLQRQYVTADLVHGLLADAGDPLNAGPGQLVTLDGTDSGAEGESPLDYEWTQTTGPPVAFDGADTPEPSFTTPSHPTLLTFSLVVSSGSMESQPDTVTVRVPSSDPRPVAIVGALREVNSDDGVSLSGAESYDPNSLPLGYAWTQTGGPPVTVADQATASPSFVAPRGPATLTFQLVVSNGEQHSDPVTQTVKVRGIAPSFLSGEETTFAAGHPGSFTIETEASPAASISIGEGSLPKGLALNDFGDGTATISGVPTGNSAPAGGTEEYPIALLATNSLAVVRQELTIVVNGKPLSPRAEEENGAPSPPAGGGWGDSGGPPPDPARPAVPKTRPRLNRTVVTLPSSIPSHRTVTVVGGEGSPVGCAGHLPVGVSCQARGAFVVVRSSGRAWRPGTYRLKIALATPEGPLQRTLSVRIRGSR